MAQWNVFGVISIPGWKGACCDTWFINWPTMLFVYSQVYGHMSWSYATFALHMQSNSRLNMLGCILRYFERVFVATFLPIVAERNRQSFLIVASWEKLAICIVGSLYCCGLQPNFHLSHIAVYLNTTQVDHASVCLSIEISWPNKQTCKLSFGLEVKWKKIKVRFVGKGHRSKFNLCLSSFKMKAQLNKVTEGVHKLYTFS